MVDPVILTEPEIEIFSKIVKDLSAKGIHVKGASMQGLAEESSEAYKEIGRAHV
jgi:RNA-splicing ligase RtcB